MAGKGIPDLLLERKVMQMDTSKIHTTYWRKPIPNDSFDWQATFADYQGGDPIAFGYSEREAINKLNAQVEEVPVSQEIARQIVSAPGMARYLTSTI
jgi:hypothetical protein